VPKRARAFYKERYPSNGITRTRLLDTESAGEFVRRRDQGAAVRWVESAVAAIGSDNEVGFGPRTVERPGAFQRADDVVTALHDHPGDMAYACGVPQQLVVGFEKSLVDEVMGFYARKGERKLILFVVGSEVRVGQEL
jgi:hypothetical protein